MFVVCAKLKYVAQIANYFVVRHIPAHVMCTYKTDVKNVKNQNAKLQYNVPVNWLSYQQKISVENELDGYFM